MTGLLALLAVSLWAWSDARWIHAVERRSDELARARRWPELRAHLYAVHGTKRPFARLVRGLLAPGIADAQLAMGLHQLMLGTEVLPPARRAAEIARRRPRLLAQVLSPLILIEDAVGHAAEARAVLPELDALVGPTSPKAAVGIVVEMHVCRLAEGIARADGNLAVAPGVDHVRTEAALLHALRGDRDAALAVLAHEPGGVDAFIDPKRLAMMQRTSAGREALERIRARYRTASRAGRQVAMAVAHLEAREAPRALEALAIALPAGAQVPWALEAIACRTRAQAYALAEAICAILLGRRRPRSIAPSPTPCTGSRSTWRVTGPTRRRGAPAATTTPAPTGPSPGCAPASER